MPLTPEEKAVLRKAEERGLLTDEDRRAVIARTEAPIPDPLKNTQGGGLELGAPNTLAARGARTGGDIIRSVASGLTRGGADELAAGANAATGLAPDYETALAAERRRDREIPLGIRIPGEALGLAVGNVATKTLPGALAQGAVQGGLYAFGSGEGGFKNRAQNVPLGASAGAAGGGLGYGVSRLLRPRPSPDVAASMKAGIRPTAGQATGGIGKTLEEKARSLPLLGEGITKAQRRAVESFDVAAVNEALRPIGVPVPKNIRAGRDLIQWGQRLFGRLYDDTLEQLSGTVDDAFKADMRGLSESLRANLPKAQRRLFLNDLKNVFGQDPLRASRITGTEAKKIVSHLTAQARRYSKSDDPFVRALADSYGDAKEIFNRLMARSNPEIGQQLGRIDSAYRNWVRIENASSRTGSKEGVFTPAALNSAARQADTTVRKRAFAAGNAPMQRFATQAENVIGNQYPDSGTAGRTLPFLLASAGAYYDPVTTAAIVGGLGAGRLAYMSASQRLLASLLAGSRPGLFGPLATGAQVAGPGAAALAPLLKGGN